MTPPTDIAPIAQHARKLELYAVARRPIEEDVPFLGSLPLAMLEPVRWWLWLRWTAFMYIYSAYVFLAVLGPVS